jgi:hypothetical protein
MHAFFYCRKDIHPTIYAILLLLCLTIGPELAIDGF